MIYYFSIIFFFTEDYYFFFFFSSRRRHTRLQGDWSSDVCSSDLLNSFTPNRTNQEHIASKSVFLGRRRLCGPSRRTCASPFANSVSPRASSSPQFSR